jgi:hypothetical protein
LYEDRKSYGGINFGVVNPTTLKLEQVGLKLLCKKDDWWAKPWT